MKLDILIVDFMLVAMVFVPYVMFILIGFQEKKELKKKFREAAKEQNLSFQEIDTWNQTIIGLDKDQQRLLFVQRRKTAFHVQSVKLRWVKQSSILEEFKAFRGSNKPADFPEKIDLELLFFNGEKQLLNFYDASITYTRDHELTYAAKWNKIINSCLQYRPTVSSAA